jgi:hypothetical protein
MGMTNVLIRPCHGVSDGVDFRGLVARDRRMNR